MKTICLNNCVRNEILIQAISSMEKHMDGVTYADMFTWFSANGYDITVYHPFAPTKRWTASVSYRPRNNSEIDCQISKINEAGETEWLQFDDWDDAAEEAISLALKLMSRHGQLNQE